MRFRRFDADLDDFIELEKPEPWTREMHDESKREMDKAWRREQSRRTEPE